MSTPNILFICTDQQRYDSLGCNGNQASRTPELDKFAASATRLDNHIVANPVCMPSRASMLTGRYPNAHGVWTNGVPLPMHETTLPMALKPRGYDTRAIGKLHMTPTQAYRGAGLMESRNAWAHGDLDLWRGPYYGFDEVSLTIGHGDEAGKHGHYGMHLRRHHPEVAARLEGIPRNEEGSFRISPSVLPLEAHHSTWIADEAERFLLDRGPGDRPFFLFCSFPDPHHPFSPPEPYASMFDPASVSLPWPASSVSAKPSHYRATGGVGRHTYGIPEDVLRLLIARTHGMVSLVDHSVGRILEALRRSGLEDETIAVFTTDHGELLGDHGLLLKGPFPCRSLLRVPCMIRVPDQADPGAVVTTPTSNTDLMPTLLELAGTDPPTAIQGESLVSLIRDGKAPVREHVMSMGWSKETGNLHNHQSLFTERWRLTWFPRLGEGELYDLERDPAESVNLFDRADHRPTRDAMMNELYREYSRTDERHEAVLAAH